MELKFYHFDSIDSTNNWIKSHINEKIAEGTVCSSDEQITGRGRKGHNWLSPKGESIATSIALFPESVDISRLSRLTLVSALCVCETIEECFGLKSMIKWPNDVLISSKKVCGILTELELDAEGLPRVVIGIGVNLHTQSFPSDIIDIATSIDFELGEDARGNLIDSKEIIYRLWEKFSIYYDRFLESGGELFIKEDYNNRLINKGRQVVITDTKGSVTGEALGIDDTGALIVNTDGGRISVDAGEVSVRGIYGYV